MGRFINADAYAITGVGLLGNNMFAYCNNNAINLVDGTGTLPFGIGPMQVAICDGGSGSSKNPYYWNDPDRPWNTATAPTVPKRTLGEQLDDVWHSSSNSVLGPLAKNINISGGVGFGLYVEGEVSEIGVGLGTYYDIAAFEWQNGKLTTYQYGYAGVTGSVLLMDVGAEASVQHGGGGKLICDRWILYNKQQDTLAIGDLAFALYTPLFGGRIELSLDWVGLYQDLGWMH